MSEMNEIICSRCGEIIGYTKEIGYFVPCKECQKHIDNIKKELAETNCRPPDDEPLGIGA